ncbi:zinc ribbon domain-containing protein [Candidatus Methanarcanum hacksteinii]|uniref:zinc ribbon domain-containing protein n=1 Tax=Candidatus Methanarcanum hacksteinii TaxID=2911857 RepID=UPI0037DC63FF
MYCKGCGKELSDGMKYCSRCGTQQNIVFSDSKNTDSGNVGWAFLAILIPPIGLTLWMKDKPKTARMLFIGSLISILGYVLTVLILSSSLRLMIYFQ